MKGLWGLSFFGKPILPNPTTVVRMMHLKFGFYSIIPAVDFQWLIFIKEDIMIFRKLPEERCVEEIQMPIDGVLDLHAFLPQEVQSVVAEYLLVCREKGIYEVKIIHGKGKGVLAHTVQAFLQKNADVIEFWTDTGPSGWGATIVRLKSNDTSSNSAE
jgi:hypothetical protein